MNKTESGSKKFTTKGNQLTEGGETNLKQGIREGSGKCPLLSDWAVMCSLSPFPKDI